MSSLTYVESGGSETIALLEFLSSNRPELSDNFTRVYPFFDFEPVSHPQIVSITEAYLNRGFRRQELRWLADLPPWVFVTVHSGLRFCHGNGNITHSYLGNLSNSSDQEHLVEKILMLEPNYAVLGYYEFESLPPLSDVLKAADRSGPRLRARM